MKVFPATISAIYFECGRERINFFFRRKLPIFDNKRLENRPSICYGFTLSPLGKKEIVPIRGDWPMILIFTSLHGLRRSGPLGMLCSRSAIGNFRPIPLE